MLTPASCHGPWRFGCITRSVVRGLANTPAQWDHWAQLCVHPYLAELLGLSVNARASHPGNLSRRVPVSHAYMHVII